MGFSPTTRDKRGISFYVFSIRIRSQLVEDKEEGEDSSHGGGTGSVSASSSS
jgi:hypothetical protein